MSEFSREIRSLLVKHYCVHFQKAAAIVGAFPSGLLFLQALRPTSKESFSSVIVLHILFASELERLAGQLSVFNHLLWYPYV